MQREWSPGGWVGMLFLLVASTAWGAGGPGRGAYSFVSDTASELDIGVNVANGNLLVIESDIDFAAIGDPSFAIGRAYNSALSGEARDFGRGWLMASGYDVRLSVAAGTVTYFDPTGARLVFTRQADGRYSPPAGFTGTLTSSAAGFVVVDEDRDRRFSFSPAGLLTREANLAETVALRIDYTSAAGQDRLSSFAEPDDRHTRPSYNGNGSIIEIDTPASEHFYYTYDERNRLRVFTAPGGRQTRYGYEDTSNRLSDITTPMGDRVHVDYDSAGRVRRYTFTWADDTQPMTARDFVYGAPGASCPTGSVGQTVVTFDGDPASTATWCYASDGRVLWESDTFNQDLGGDDIASCDLDPLGDDTPSPTYCGEQDSDELSQWPSLGDPAVFSVTTAAPPLLPLPSRFAYGFGDQKGPGTPFSMFEDPDWLRLDVKYVRLVVSYDIVREGAVAGSSNARRLANAVAWVQAARAQGREVIVSFEHCTNEEPGKPETDNPAIPGPLGADRQYCARFQNAPMPSAYLAAVKRFINYTYTDASGASVQPFAGIRLFTAWNEPNLGGTQPTAKTFVRYRDNARNTAAATIHNSGAVRAGRYWALLYDYCANGGNPRCIVGAGDFLDSKLGDIHDKGYGRRYLDQYRKGMGKRLPQFWALHPYSDLREQARPVPGARPWRRLYAFLRRTHTDFPSSSPQYQRRNQVPIWLTEGGAQYRRGSKPAPVGDPRGQLTEAEGNLITQRLLTEAPRQTSNGDLRRIKAVLPYQWRGDDRDDYGFRRFLRGWETPPQGQPPLEENGLRPQYYTYCGVLNVTCPPPP